MLNEYEINELARYAKFTKSDKGMDMPTLEIFREKIKMAIALAPQVNSSGEINYLFGKGVGAELAIRGNVKGRKKYNRNFPYRCHSDFEIYDANGMGYTEEFKKVFGAQECFPKTKTKALSGMDETLMDATYETVEYEGNEYLIPELEILFLDKFLRKEGTPRKEGCDAILLLKEYDLDMEKIKKYYEQYVVKQEEVDYEKFYDPQIEAFEKRALNEMECLLEDEEEEITLENKVNKLKQKIEIAKRFYAYYSHGIRIDICPDIDKIEYINENGEIHLSNNTKTEIYNMIEQLKDEKEKENSRILQEIDLANRQATQEKLLDREQEEARKSDDIGAQEENIEIIDTETAERYLRSIIEKVRNSEYKLNDQEKDKSL